jgi:FlaA1/EpsC-like NDP-sugar epimerase
MINTIDYQQKDLDAAVLNRDYSHFTNDIAEKSQELRAMVSGKRILVVGGGGSIGSATTMLLADLSPESLHVVDQSENYLAELVRDLRGRPGGLAVRDFRSLPLDYGSSVMGRFLADAPPYDAVLNFAALKHVRSEKDVYSLLQMIDTNVIRHVRFRRWLKAGGHGARYFAVSTDKAANPTSLMGASKRLMEDVVFNPEWSANGVDTTARFANVAFSNGSLLQGFLMRLAKGQPLAAPRDTRRYFVSQRESGEICLLASLLGKPGTIMFPKMDPVSELQMLDGVATRVLAKFGYEAVVFDDEEEARKAVAPLARERRWPLLLTELDTSGEKPYEEFVGQGESVAESGLKTLGAVRHVSTDALTPSVLEMLEKVVENADVPIDKVAIVNAIKAGIPGFAHRETGKSLDDRM